MGLDKSASVRLESHTTLLLAPLDSGTRDPHYELRSGLWTDRIDRDTGAVGRSADDL